LQELEQANEILGSVKADLGGDVIYGGKTAKWQQAVNAFRLRLLLHLSKKEGDNTLNIKKQFADIVGNPTKYPLMKDIADNAQLTFNTSAPSNYYPTFNNLSVSSLVSLEKGLVKLLKDRNDLRLFQYGDPIVGKSANDFASYEGVDAGLIISDQQNAAPNASKIHRRFVKSEVNEPLILIGFPEQEFLIAEGVARGWAAGNAAGFYNSGVRASMRSYGVGGIGIEQYLSRPNVKYDPAKALELIAIQKYLALYMQSGWEPFFEQRRTGFPTFSIGPGTLNGGRIPKRWRYPQGEYEINRANVRAAVERQYGGSDDVNQEMWLLR
jgi:Starch-binding associating with outer membrane